MGALSQKELSKRIEKCNSNWLQGKTTSKGNKYNKGKKKYKFLSPIL